MYCREGTLLLVTLVSGAACRQGQNPPGWETTIDTLDSGAIHVVHTPPPHAEAWFLEEVLRVGTADEEGPSSFARLHGLVVLDDQRFAVLDGITQDVRVFSADGTPAAVHGKKGSGPGEFETAFGLMRDSRGHLWVPDYRNARMTVLDPDVGLLRSKPLRVLSRGFVWSGAMMNGDRLWKPSISIGPPRTNIMRVFDSEVELIDSLPLRPDPPVDRDNPPGAFRWEAPDGRSGGYAAVPFYPSTKTVIDPAGAIWSTGYGDPSYRIVRWVPGGDTTLILETNRESAQIPTTERDSAIAQVREYLADVGGAEQDWSKVPTAYPAITGLFLSEAGDLWVETREGENEVFDVYDRSGKYQKTVVNSLNTTSWLKPVVRGNDLWAVVEDEMGVQFVVRGRLVPPGDPIH